MTTPPTVDLAGGGPRETAVLATLIVDEVRATMEGRSRSSVQRQLAQSFAAAQITVDDGRLDEIARSISRGDLLPIGVGDAATTRGAHLGDEPPVSSEHFAAAIDAVTSPGGRSAWTALRRALDDHPEVCSCHLAEPGHQAT